MEHASCGRKVHKISSSRSRGDYGASGSGDQASELIDVAKDALEIGEIILQGNLCAKEYYKDPGATEKLFAGGWMHMGDLTVWHPDGAIQVLDRAKDIIISGEFNPLDRKFNIRIILTIPGGENISSVAVESILMKHPDIIEAAVIGVPDERWGETPMKFALTVLLDVIAYACTRVAWQRIRYKHSAVEEVQVLIRSDNNFDGIYLGPWGHTSHWIEVGVSI